METYMAMIEAWAMTYQTEIVAVVIAVAAFWLVLKLTKKIIHAVFSVCVCILIAYLKARYLHL